MVLLLGPHEETPLPEGLPHVTERLGTSYRVHDLGLRLRRLLDGRDAPLPTAENRS